MNGYKNFTSKYVSNGIPGSIDVIKIYEHKNGVKTSIDYYWEDNNVHMQFESGKAVSVTLNNGFIKIYLADDFRERDLKTHPVWSTSPTLVLSVYMSHILRSKLSVEELEAVKEFVLSELYK